MDVVGTLLGALVGALAGYGFAQYQQSQERKARRLALLNLLEAELKRLPQSVPQYDASKAFYRDRIWLSAPGRLLDDGVLEFRKDPALVEMLLNLKVALSRHNDFVQVTNQAQAAAAIPDNVHKQWHDDLKDRLRAIGDVADGIRSLLSR